MFRATLCPSSGEITLSMRHWYLSLCMCGIWSAGWSETPTRRPDATHTEWQIPMSHRYSNYSWWWVHGCPKHVEKRNKYTKQNFAPSWMYLQDCTRMHDEQKLKKAILPNFSKSRKKRKRYWQKFLYSFRSNMASTPLNSTDITVFINSWQISSTFHATNIFQIWQTVYK